MQPIECLNCGSIGFDYPYCCDSPWSADEAPVETQAAMSAAPRGGPRRPSLEPTP